MVVGDGSIRCNGRGEQGKDALAYAPKGFARTQSQLSTHRPSPYEKREGRCGFGRVGGVTIPPVVARIFSGDSTSPLTREASVVVQARDG